MTTQADIINASIAEAATLKSDAEDAVRDLQTAASAYFLPDFTQVNFDTMPSWDAAVPTSDEVGTGDLVVGDAPELPGDVVAWYNKPGREVSVAGLGGLPEDRPGVVIPPFVYNPEDYISSDLLEKYSYQSDFFDNFLDPQLREFIEAESYFINEQVQDALFQQTRERDLQSLNDSLDAVDRQGAQQRGFPIPTSMLKSEERVAIKAYQDIQSDRNKEITALIAERAHDGVKHSIDASVKMEDIRSRFQLEFGRLYFQVMNFLVDKYRADVSAEIARVNSELEMIKLTANVDLSMAGNDLTLTGVDSEMQNALLDAIMQKFSEDAKVNLTEAELGKIKQQVIMDMVKYNHEKQLTRFKGVAGEVSLRTSTWKQSAQMNMEAAAKGLDYYTGAVLGTTSQVNAINYLDET